MIPEISEASILDLKKGEDIIFRCGKCGYILLIELKIKNN